jgi:hypothetical protein
VAQDVIRVRPDQRAMDSWVADRLIEWATGPKGAGQTKDFLRTDLDRVASELAGPDPTPVEKVLAETAALSWFALRMHEAQYVGGATSEQGFTIPQSEHSQRRVERAHRRLMATLKMLATVRRLGVPALQVNIARNQVNVAGEG